MELIEKATIMHFHRHRLDTEKPGTVRALGWRGPESQQKRFDVIKEVGDMNGATVLDVGCGHADLKAYLDLHFRGFHYIGIDQMPEFMSEARARFGDQPNTTLCQSDFTRVDLPTVDYVIACGVLNYRCKNPGFYFDMIRRMFDAADKALAFNMLDVENFPDHPLLLGHNCEEVTEFCRSLTPHVTVIRGYVDDDFTLFLHREAQDIPS